jgi:serine/threonine protein kinase
VAGTTNNGGVRPHREEYTNAKRQGRYVLGELLGRGGMAEVFQGNSIGSHGFQKPVAIKRLLPELANDEVFVERLIGEAKLLVGMAHGNIVSVLDLARDGDDVFLVMEFVDGPSLRQLMKARGDRGVSLGVATYVVQAAAAGLEFAHNRPGGAVIHADISPSNILLTTSGEVRVADFGIARREGGGVGVVEGKWAYMAPEQARGEALTPRSDVFALGVVLYELLCGEHPLGRQVTAGERELEPKKIIPPRQVRSSIPPGLDAICMKALAFEPRDRYSRMQNLIDALVDERFANGYREGANDLAHMIREITPGSGSAKEQTQHTNRPLTIVTSSLLSQLNMRASSPRLEALVPSTVAVSDDLVPKIADSAAQTRAVLASDLPPELRALAMEESGEPVIPPLPVPGKSAIAATAPMPMPTPPRNSVAPPPNPSNVVLSPPAYMLNPDMLPAPEMSSIHGGTLSGAGSVDVAIGNRNYKWAAGVFALAAIAGVTTAVVTQLGGSSPELHTVSWDQLFTPIFHVEVPDQPLQMKVTSPPAPPPAPPPPTTQVATAEPPQAAGSGSAAIAAAPSGSASGSNAPLVDAKPDSARSGNDRPRRDSHGHLSGAAVTHAHADAAPTGEAGSLRMELDNDGFALVTINGQHQQSPGAHFHLPGGAYTARIKDDDGTFSCKVIVEPGKTVTYTISLEDSRCEPERN